MQKVDHQGELMIILPGVAGAQLSPGFLLHGDEDCLNDPQDE